MSNDDNNLSPESNRRRSSLRDLVDRVQQHVSRTVRSISLPTSPSKAKIYVAPEEGIAEVERQRRASEPVIDEIRVKKGSLAFTNDANVRVPAKMERMNARAAAYLEEIFERGLDSSSSNRRDFLAHLMCSKESARLNFSKVQVPETVKDAEAKLNNFFSVILKYNPQVINIVPPKNIELSEEVTEHLRLHQQLTQAINEYKALDAVVQQNDFYHPDEADQKYAEIAKEFDLKSVYEQLQKKWVFSKAEWANDFMGDTKIVDQAAVHGARLGVKAQNLFVHTIANMVEECVSKTKEYSSREEESASPTTVTIDSDVSISSSHS